MVEELSHIPSRELSHIPSVAILQALEDLETIEKNPRYEINMGTWHQPSQTKCHVCLAGCVMAQRFNVEIHRNAMPQDQRLRGLDQFRMGYISKGLEYFNIYIELPNWKFIFYHDNAEGFKTKLRELATYLKSHGF